MGGRPKKRLTCGALFSGIGGFCFGFEKAGFETAWALDIDKDATATYAENFLETEVVQEDIRKINQSKPILDPVTILHAGFPCQSFSPAGNRKGFEDERGMLFFEIVDLIKSWGKNKPKILVFENSAFLLHGEGGLWFNKIQFEIQRLGYWFNVENAVIIDTKEHAGLPQRRERLFMVAIAMDFMDYNPFTGISSVAESIDLEGILQLGEEDEAYYMPEDNKYTKKISAAMRQYNDIRLFQFRRMQLRPQPPGHCPTLTANMGTGGHNVPFVMDGGRLRKLTERECLGLQGFDASSFRWAETTLATKYRLIGNAVSPMISEKIASTIGKILGANEHVFA